MVKDIYRASDEVFISFEALERAKSFIEMYNGTNTVVAFNWVESSQVQYPGENIWKELGFGIDIGTHKRADIPSDRLWQKQNMQFAVIIPQDVLEQYEKREIDITDREGYLFELK